ncbi:MAG: hypothetical protein ACAH83_16865 [Alphaproteobacteria bacterium]
MDTSADTSASFKAAARGKVVDYADAHPELRREMENVMDPIDRNPESFEAIHAYGRSVQARADDIMDQMKLAADRNPLNPQALRQTMIDAEKLGLHRLDVTRDLSLLLGTTKEVLRRYNEEYIPQAERDFRASNDPEDELYLKDVLKRQNDFIDRIAELEKARGDSIIAGIGLRHRMEDWEAIRASGNLETKIVVFSHPLRLKTS